MRYLLGDVESFLLSDECEGNVGLGTSLRKQSTATLAPIASKEVEAFVDDKVRMLLSDANKDKPQPETKKVKRIGELDEKLKESKSIIVVPMDKMNSFRVIKKEKYIDWDCNHLNGVAQGGIGQ